MIKNLATLTLAVSLLASPVSALETETSKGSNLANHEIQNLYPNLRGDNVVAINFIKNRDGLPVINVQYDLSNDGIADIQYSYRSKRKIGNSVILTYPFAVTIDENGKFDEDEAIYLGSETSESLNPKKSTNSFNLYPELRGDHLVSLGFAEIQNNLIAIMQYFSKSNTPVTYAYKVIFKKEVFYLREPFKAFFDFDDNGVVGDGEIFDLTEEPLEDTKKGWNI